MEADDTDLGRKRPWSYPKVADALETADMPPQSLALYARWWQLETWLRELAYVELRALLGTTWSDVCKAALTHQAKDAAYPHMAGIDNDNPLAYLQYTELIRVISEYWDQFAHALLERRAWDGRQAELAQIRHRIGHLRKPHADDLGRLEQILRDLERGTFIALASYNSRRDPNPDNRSDPVTTGWVGGKHRVAERLLDHADIRYGTRLRMSVSRRPWNGGWPDDFNRASGLLWHAGFFLRDRAVEASALWQDNYVDVVRPLIVHMLADNPHHIEFTFSAVDSGTEVSDAIGNVLEAVLHHARYPYQSEALAIDVEEGRAWSFRAKQIDYRVLNGTGWNIVDETTVPITNFGAGGAVHSVPRW